MSIGTRRIFDGVGRHAIGSNPDGTLKGHPDDVRKVLARNGVPIGDMDTLHVDHAYAPRHSVLVNR